MAKVGYIFIATNGEEYAEDKAWMQQYGCVQVIEELSEHERLRPMWKQLISSLERGRDLKGIITQYLTTVKPMHYMYVEPTRALADIVINSGKNDVAFDLFVSKIGQLLESAGNKI